MYITKIYFLNTKYFLKYVIKCKLTRNNQVSYLGISLREWIKYPPTSNKESFVCEVVLVGEGVEAVDPEAELVELRAVEPGVRLQPVGGDEAGGHEHDHDEPEAERHVARQGALPVGVGVGQQVVPHTHLATSQQQQQQQQQQGQLQCSDHSNHRNHP